jgi:hypothetical protein
MYRSSLLSQNFIPLELDNIVYTKTFGCTKDTDPWLYLFWLYSPVVLEEGVFTEASSNDRVKFLLAERLLWGGVVVTFEPEAALVGGALDSVDWGERALWEAALVGGVGSLACSRWTVTSTAAPPDKVW